MTKQEKMKNFILNIINWWEAEDCAFCPLHNICQYEGIELEEEPPCIENIAKYILKSLDK